MLLLTWRLAAVSRRQSALGAICLLGSLCGALGVLCACDLAAANQVLGTSVLPEEQKTAGGADGKG